MATLQEIYEMNQRRMNPARARKTIWPPDATVGVYMKTWDGRAVPMAEILEGVKVITEHNARIDKKEKG